MSESWFSVVRYLFLIALLPFFYSRADYAAEVIADVPVVSGGARSMGGPRRYW